MGREGQDWEDENKIGMESIEGDGICCHFNEMGYNRNRKDIMGKEKGYQRKRRDIMGKESTQFIYIGKRKNRRGRMGI